MEKGNVIAIETLKISIAGEAYPRRYTMAGGTPDQMAIALKQLPFCRENYDEDSLTWFVDLNGIEALRAQGFMIQEEPFYQVKVKPSSFENGSGYPFPNEPVYFEVNLFIINQEGKRVIDDTIFLRAFITEEYIAYHMKAIIQEDPNRLMNPPTGWDVSRYVAQWVAHIFENILNYTFLCEQNDTWTPEDIGKAKKAVRTYYHHTNPDYKDFCALMDNGVAIIHNWRHETTTAFVEYDKKKQLANRRKEEDKS